jgi:hypothetical protein
MKNQDGTLVSVQSPFAIDNLFNNERFTFNITIYGRVFPPNQASYFEPLDSWKAYSSGRVLSTTTRRDNHGTEAGYTISPTMFAMTGTTNHCMFYISGDEKLVSYKSMTAGGEVIYSYVVFDDIIGGVGLKVVPQPTNALASNDKAKPRKSNVMVVDDVHHIHDIDAESQPRINDNKSNSIIIPDTERFSLLTNVSMYFSKTIFQWTSLGWRGIDSKTQDTFGLFGGYYSLTGNDDMLYPEGVSNLEIYDGFSQGTATIEFNHNTSDKTVKITVISHTTRTCDFREVEVAGYYYPYTLCFAL